MQAHLDRSQREREERSAEILSEIVIGLEHNSQIFSSRETKAAVDVRRHIVITHLLTRRPGERDGHLRAG